MAAASAVWAAMTGDAIRAATATPPASVRMLMAPASHPYRPLCVVLPYVVPNWRRAGSQRSQRSLPSSASPRAGLGPSDLRRGPRALRGQRVHGSFKLDLDL